MLFGSRAASQGSGKLAQLVTEGAAYGQGECGILEGYMQLTVEHRLNVRFVDAAAADTDSFEHDAVLVTVAINKPDEPAFALVTCAGVIEVAQPVTVASSGRESAVKTGERLLGWEFPFLLQSDIDARWDPHLTAAYQHVKAVLEEVGKLLRWRFGLSGPDSVFRDTRVLLNIDRGHVLELQPIAQAAMGDDRAAIDRGSLSEVASMLASDMHEPLAHQLWREAWNLRLTNPRSALVIGIAAAEVGLKQLIGTLVPLARWLVQELPSPPLVNMMKNYLPDLPIKADVERDRRSPKHLRAMLDTAVQARNDVIHRGDAPDIDLRATLAGVREFLYLLDLYEGRTWAVTKLSDETILALGITRRIL
jgi:hypothetical protein